MPGWRRNLSAIWLAQMLAIVGFNARAPFFIFFLRDDLGVRSTQALTVWSGVLNAVGALPMIVAAPVWGVIADRYGRKPMVLRAMASGCVLSVLAAFAQAPWQVLVLRALEGATLGTVSASVAYVASIAPKERLAFSLGLMQMAVFSGSSIGPFVGGFAAAAFGYRPALALSGALLGLGALIVFFFVAERFTPRPVTAARGPTIVATTFKHLHNRLLLVLIAVPLIAQIGNQSVAPLVPLFVQQLVGVGGNAATLTGLMLGLGGIAGAIAAIVFGRIADRANPKWILLGCMIAGGLAYLPQGLAQTVVVLIVFRVLFGLTLGGIGPTTNALLAESTPPDERGSVYGLQQAMTSAGGLIGPLGASLLAAATSLRLPFFITAAILLGGGLWVWRVVPDTLRTAPLPPPPPDGPPARPAPASGGGG